MSIEEKLRELFTEQPHYKKSNSKVIANKLGCYAEEIAKIRKSWRNTSTKTFHKANILILDIETSPLRAYIWSRWKQNIYLDQTISEWFMLTWSAKWLGEEKIYSSRLTGSEVLREDDSRIIADLWYLLDQADIVIAHNGKSFDIPKINARFIINGLPPVSPYKQIDTKEVAVKKFGFSSNKLDALAGYFHINHKIKTDFSLWSDCMEGKEEALEYMETYNREDVNILEQVYYRLRPWIDNHPNVALYDNNETPTCPYCGSHWLSLENKEYTFTPTGKYTLVRCADCGGISRTGINLVNKNKRKNLLRPAK